MLIRVYSRDVRPRGLASASRPKNPGLGLGLVGFGLEPRGLSRPTAETKRNVIGSKSITNSQKSLMPLRIASYSLTLSVNPFIHKNIRQFFGRVTLRKNTKTTSSWLPASAACLLAFLVFAWVCRLPIASAVLSLLMQLQFYIFDLHYASVFQLMLSPTGAPEQSFPINDYVICSGHAVQATVKLTLLSSRPVLF